MNNKYFSRQSTLIDPEALNKKVTIIGVGGIGSWTTLALAKLGIRYFNLYDMDSVGEENIASQVYDYRHTDMPKVLALKSIIERQGEDWNTEEPAIKTFVEDVTKISSLEDSDIIISAVDSLEVRQKIWKNFVAFSSASLYIDGRMGGEYIRIFAINLMDQQLMDRYEDTVMNPQSKPADIPCSERAIVYNTQVNGAMVASLVKKYLAGQSYPNQLVFDLDAYTIKALAL